MLIGIDNVAVSRYREKVVAVPARLKRHEQTVQRQGSDGGERELRRREHRSRAACREGWNDQAERRQGRYGRKRCTRSFGVERDD
jgi:hypothetical protein